MSLMTFIQTAETDTVGLLKNSAAIRTKLVAAIATVEADADKAAKLTELVLGALGLEGPAAATVAVDGAIDVVGNALQAAGAATTGEVTASLPATLVGIFNTAKTAVLADWKALKAAF